MKLNEWKDSMFARGKKMTKPFDNGYVRSVAKLMRSANYSGDKYRLKNCSFHNLWSDKILLLWFIPEYLNFEKSLNLKKDI